MLTKKLYVLVLFLLLCGFTTNAQIYVTAEASFPKIGLFSNHSHTFGPVGMYQYAQYGHTNKYEFNAETVKVGFGASLPIAKGNLALYGGVNYQWFYNVYDNNPYIDLNLTYAPSFDLGISRNDTWGSVLFLIDPLNREVTVGLYYKFLKFKRYR